MPAPQAGNCWGLHFCSTARLPQSFQKLAMSATCSGHGAAVGLVGATCGQHLDCTICCNPAHCCYKCPPGRMTCPQADKGSGREAGSLGRPATPQSAETTGVSRCVAVSGRTVLSPLSAMETAQRQHKLPAHLHPCTAEVSTFTSNVEKRRDLGGSC